MADDLEALNDAMFAVLDGEDATSLVDAVRAARDAGADLHAWWFEAASWAITESSMVLLDALAQAGVDWPGLHAVGETGEDRAPLIDCLLAQALTSGVTTPELVCRLLALGADVNRRWNGRPIFNSFCARGADLDTEVLKVLLEAGPDLTATDGKGVTALMETAGREGMGRDLALALLMAAGADPSCRDNEGRSAADRAAAASMSAYLEILGRHAYNPGAATASQAAFDDSEMPPGGFFVLEPLGEPPALRWVGRAADAQSA